MRDARRGGLALAVTLVASGITLSYACSSFDDERSTTPPDAAADGAPFDANAGDADAAAPIALEPPVIVATDPGVVGIAVDATHVYWASSLTNELRRTAKSGPDAGTPETLATGQRELRDVLVDLTDAYVVRGNAPTCGTPDDTVLGRWNKGTKSITTVVSACNTGPAFRFASDGPSIAISTLVPSGAGIPQIYVVAKPNAGSRKAKEGGFVPGAVAIQGSHVYWTNAGSSTIDAEERDGGAKVTGVKAVELAADVDALYWIDVDGNLFRIAHAADGSPTRLASTPGEPGRLAIYGDRVWWTSPASGRVLSIPKTGGQLDVVAQAQPEPMAIAIASDGIYWANRLDGSIRVSRFEKR